jgi:hypothetical protein
MMDNFRNEEWHWLGIAWQMTAGFQSSIFNQQSSMTLTFSVPLCLCGEKVLNAAQ